MPLKLRLKAICSKVDFSISTAEHLGWVGQRDQQGGTNGKGQDQAGLRNALRKYIHSLPVVISLLGA